MILGITGLAGAGKDTIADVLVREHRFTKVALADHFKRYCRDVFDFSDDQMWGPSSARNAPDERYPRVWAEMVQGGAHSGPAVGYLTPRLALQKLGTEFGRHCYENVWIDLAICVAETLQGSPLARYDQKRGLTFQFLPTETPQHVVIPDVRFQNEIDAIKKAGGYVVRVTRAGSGLSGSAAAHVSETEGASIPDSEFDWVFRNDGPIGLLPEMVEFALGALLATKETT